MISTENIADFFEKWMGCWDKSLSFQATLKRVKIPFSWMGYFSVNIKLVDTSDIDKWRFLNICPFLKLGFTLNFFLLCVIYNIRLNFVQFFPPSTLKDRKKNLYKNKDKKRNIDI